MLAYFVLALLVTYPAVLQFTQQVPGDLLADRDQNLWNLWWVSEALGRAANPFHTDMLYHPYGADLYYHTLGLPLGVIGFVPGVLWGLPAAYNTVLLVGFTLSGVGAFRLALLYTHNPVAAFLGGVVFAFTPYTLDALKGQTEVLSLQWMPLYAEAWLRTVQEGKGRWAVAAGLFFALAAYTSLYYAVYLVLFTLAHLAYLFLQRRRNADGRGLPAGRRLLLPLLIVPALAFVLTLPLLIGLLTNYGNPRLAVEADLGHRLAHSADLLSFLAPPHDHPLLMSGGRPGVEEPAIHDYLSLGYVALALSILGAVTAWRRRETRFWVALGLVALLLSMGQQLQIGRNLTGIPLPFVLLEGLPGLDAISKPERFVVLARLCMGVLAAWGVLRLVGWGGAQPHRRLGPRRTLLAFAVLLGLLLAELPIHPRYVQPLDTPQPFSELARLPYGALMELPFSTQQATTGGERMRYQTLHGKPIMTGYLARTYNSPIVDSCSPFWGFISPRDVPREGEEIASPLVVDRPLDVLNLYGIRYIALYSRYGGRESNILEVEDRQAYEGIISQVAPVRLGGDDYLTVNAVTTSDPGAVPASFHIGSGWYKAESTGGQPFRWLDGNRARLCVFAPRPITGRLTLEATSFHTESTLSISQEKAGDGSSASEPIYKGTVQSGGIFTKISTDIVSLEAGMSAFELHAEKLAISPRSLDPATNDERLLTVGIRLLKLELAGQK